MALAGLASGVLWPTGRSFLNRDKKGTDEYGVEEVERSLEGGGLVAVGKAEA